MKKDRATIRCKFCNWKRFVWIGRKGKRAFGPNQAWGATVSHMRDHHPSEWINIAKECAEVEQESIKYVSVAPTRNDLWYETYRGGYFDHYAMSYLSETGGAPPLWLFDL
jgi:hypothetical protein